MVLSRNFLFRTEFLCFKQISDFGFGFSVFYVTDIDGNKIGDIGTVNYIQKVIS